MKIVSPRYDIEKGIDGESILKKIELAGRVCYKSEDKITDTSAREFIKKIIKSGHHSVIEHEKVTVRIICDRGVSHAIVRHRLASYSQESTIYCNYTRDRFGNEISVIRPIYWEQDTEKYNIWKQTMEYLEEAYFKLIEKGASAQEARGVLPTHLKTEIIMTMNLREWRHFFKMRTDTVDHPQTKEITRPLLQDFKKLIPVIFDDITY